MDETTEQESPGSDTANAEMSAKQGEHETSETPGSDSEDPTADVTSTKAEVDVCCRICGKDLNHIRNQWENIKNTKTNVKEN